MFTHHHEFASREATKNPARLLAAARAASQRPDTAFAQGSLGRPQGIAPT